MSVVLTAAEMFAVTRLADGQEAREAQDGFLGLVASEHDDDRVRDGFASLVVRGLAEAGPERAKLSGEVAGVAAALSSVTRWLMLSAGRGDTIDNTHVVEGDDVTCLITPRAMETFRVDAYGGLDAAAVIGELCRRHLGADGKAALAVSDGLDAQRLLLAGRRDEEGTVLLGTAPSTATDVTFSDIPARVRELMA